MFDRLRPIDQTFKMKHLFTITLFLVAFSLSAQSYFAKDGIAINGYDAVAYFKSNAAMEGKKQFAYVWQNVTWQFTDQSNLDAFKLNPEKYAPQFGGYCAYGVSQNHKSPTEPGTFTVIDNKLYLNYNMQVRDMWRKDTDGLIKKATGNWSTLKDKN
jgi:hypothetical protein